MSDINNKSKWKSYLRIDFPDTISEKDIEKIRVSLQDLLLVNTKGIQITKIDYTTGS